jgi:formylglycine-generating enzyme required for sulfatase activity/tRNA A-37 threonylcarbamoyl transferase component Bud32/DNA-directed RNA polymerase subunit RPC12/RpoP
MSLCLNPDCRKSDNPKQANFCQRCGERLLINERYRAFKQIGQGGFGRTFIAVDEAKPSHPACVIKQFFPKDQGTETLSKAAELFRQEAERLNQLGKHAQIPDLLAYFEQNSRLYLVQEFIAGQDLAEVVRRKGRLSETQVRKILTALLEILRFVHGNKVIHRDIKPENIIFRPKDKKIFLVDFGAAKVAAATSLEISPGTLIGDPRYIAPEQAAGKATYASDLYSLGLTCVYLLTGTPTAQFYNSYDDSWLWRNYLGKNSVGEVLGEILDGMIVRATGQRYDSATAVLKSLNTIPSLPLAIFEVAKTNTTGQIVRRNQGRAEVLLENLENGIFLELMAVPGGKFLMGSPATEPGHLDPESPQHPVSVSPFFLGKTPVTQQQWLVVAQSEPVEMTLNPYPSAFYGNHRPVEQVTWREAVEFCARLSRDTGKEFRLPSEAEWEYACRGGTTTPYHFGEGLSPSLANFEQDETTDVEIFGVANAFGLYDLHGLVWEWCADPWHDDYQDAVTDGQVWQEQGESLCRVIRGGAWGFAPEYCRSATRNWCLLDSGFNFIGFRVAVSGK